MTHSELYQVAVKNQTVPDDVIVWFGNILDADADGDATACTEPLIYVRLATNPDVFANVPLRFLDERVEWSIPGDKCAAVVISHYWKGTDVCVKRAPHVCLAVLAEVKTEQGLMNQPVASPVPVDDDPTKPFTLSSPL